ncbi:uncharacterized protein TNCV_3457481 [Trichonephila clavipes]|nr:uncharacterized protein TNCV_3457481 [Trichonephila clavipes]
MDSTGLGIMSKLARLGQRKQVCLQWIPSHVGAPGNRQLMSWLVGVVILLTQFFCLQHSEIHSLHRAKINLTWRNPPAHHWYAAKSPGLSLHCRRFRALQMALARFRSGHLRGITFAPGVKSFFTCPCSFSLSASPAHFIPISSLIQCINIQLKLSGATTHEG